MSQQINETGSSRKPRPIKKWTNQEIQDLKRIVAEVNPQSNPDWKEVCLRMHSRHSRRRPCDYKAKFSNELSKKERKDFIENSQLEKDICHLFEQGKSPCQIARILGEVQIKTVVEILNNFLDRINRVLVRILGGNKWLKPKDYRLWKWMKENSEKDVERLEQVQTLCVWLKQLRRPQSEFRKKSPENYEKIRRQIQEKLRKFNQKVEICSNKLLQTDKGSQILEQTEEIQPKQVKNQVLKTSAVSLLHLKSVSEFPEQFKTFSSLFSEENLDKMDPSMEKFLNAGLKTSIDLQAQCADRHINESTHLSQDKEEREAESFRQYFQQLSEGYNDGKFSSQNDFF